MDRLERLRRFNRWLTRVTWVFLTIGLVDHFIFEEWLHRPLLPRDLAAGNLTLLWILIGILIASEIFAMGLRRRAKAAAKKPDEAA